MNKLLAAIADPAVTNAAQLKARFSFPPPPTPGGDWDEMEQRHYEADFRAREATQEIARCYADLLVELFGPQAQGLAQALHQRIEATPAPEPPVPRDHGGDRD